MLRFFLNFDLVGICFEKTKNWTFLKFFQILKILKIRDSSFVALLILRHFIYRVFGVNLTLFIFVISPSSFKISTLGNVCLLASLVVFQR